MKGKRTEKEERRNVDRQNERDAELKKTEKEDRQTPRHRV